MRAGNLAVARRQGRLHKAPVTAGNVRLSAVLWIVTATDAGATPEPVRKHLAVVELRGYTEQEKLVIAERHLLTHRFDEPVRTAAGWLAPESPILPSVTEPAVTPDVPAVVGESVDARRHQLLGVIVVEDDVAEAAWYNAGWPFPTCPVSRNAAC